MNRYHTMQQRMSKPKAAQPDVLILGSHPACYYAAALLQEAGVGVLHASIPDEQTKERLVLVNPELFSLHKILASIKTKVPLAPIYGLRFVGDEPDVQSEHVTKGIS